MEKSSLKFLADEHISPVLISILHKVGERSIQRVAKVFGVGTPDEDWIPSATEWGFVCLTYDRRMLTSSVVAPVFESVQARVVFIGSHLAGAPLWDQALWMLRFWRKIRTHAETMQPGSLVRVHKNGRIVPVRAVTSSPRRSKGR